jgi:hypothetical protein
MHRCILHPDSGGAEAEDEILVTFSGRLIFGFQFFRPFPAPGPGGVTRINKLERLLHSTCPHAPGTIRIIHAEVATHGFAGFRIDHDRSERADEDAGMAADTFFLERDNSTGKKPTPRVHRTNLDAGRFYTGLAKYRNERVDIPELLNPDPGMVRAAVSKMQNRAGHFTAMASGAPVRVHNNEFVLVVVGHFSSL